MKRRLTGPVRRLPGRRRAGTVGLALLIGLLTVGCVPTPSTPDEQPQPDTGTLTGQGEPGSRAASSWALITDYGNCDEGEQQVAAMVAAWNPAIVATAGDNTQGVAGCVPFAQSVGNYYSAFVSGPDGPRLFPVPGNHDYENEGAGQAAYLDYFAYLGALGGGGLWYQAEIGGANLFMLDSELDDAELERQRSWLQRALTEARLSEPRDWNIVVFHRPVFTSGPHEPNLRMRPEAGWDYAEWGADLVVAGHQHVYEELEVDGLPYLVAGVGASDIARQCPVPLVAESGGCVEGFGALRVTATDSRLVLDYRVPDGGQGRSVEQLELSRGG
ncbi:metallophosphoesterase family protein [Microbacterium sp. NPDC055455]